MINDFKEIIGIIFMTIVGITMLGVLAKEMPNQVASSFTGLAIVLIILAAITGVGAIINKIAKR